MRKLKLLLLLTQFITLVGCSGGEVNFDSFFSIYGYLDHETSSHFVLPLIQNKNSEPSEISLRQEEYNEINMIFDVSAGLVDGFIAAEKTIIKPLYEAFENRNLYKCGFEKAETCLLHTGNIDFFKSRSTYNFPWSFIKGGLIRATENPNEISVFFTDYLYDDGSNSYPASNNIKTSNILNRGWELSAFKDWFSHGGRIFIQVVPYRHEKWKQETNYYAIYFIPRNAKFETTERIQRLFSEIKPIVVDPLNVSFDSREFEEVLSSNESIYNGEPKIYHVNQERAYAWVGLKYDESKSNKVSNLGSISMINNSIWNVEWSIDALNISSSMKEDLNSSMLSWSSDDAKYIFTKWEHPSGNISFSDKSEEGFNAIPYQQRPDIFIAKHEVKINRIVSAILDGEFKDQLTCLVKPDNQPAFFINESLFIDIDAGIENSKNAVLKMLQEKPMFRLYTFTSVGKY
jgi:hypothetical protein